MAAQATHELYSSQKECHAETAFHLRPNAGRTAKEFLNYVCIRS
jgi:hypothetical protein